VEEAMAEVEAKEVMEEVILGEDHKMKTLHIMNFVKKKMFTHNQIARRRIPSLKLNMLKIRLRAICSSPIVISRLKKKMVSR